MTIQASGTESLWDEILPAEVKALPQDLARLDELLADPGLLAPIGVRWERLLAETGSCAGRGRPTIAMETYVRLMIVKHRSGWGYETLMREVSDSLHLRRFCRIGMTDPVPDESTVRKLTRRLGAEVVHEITREVIQKARRERRFRPRAARIDSTVIEADVRWPTDAGLAADGVRALAREGRKLATRVAERRTAVRDRSRAMGRKLRGLTRTIRKRTGEAKREVLELTEQTGRLLETSITEARKLAATARRRARGRGAQAKLKAARRLEELADRCEKVCSQIRQRVAGEPITDRLISLWDPDARPIRKGKLGKPTEFGYVDQLCEITANTRRGARGFILPPTSKIGNPAENTLLPDTAEELKNLGITLKEIMLDGGFMPTPSNTALEDLTDTIHITGRQESGSRRTRRRRQRYRTGVEGRISHLKRGYGMDRSRLKGDTGHQIWAGWAALSYNAETYTTLG
ncbi:MAG TPA: transposase [Mycobacteriales bacterium]|nr:transposase [Mycobacteriales bacterium]